MDTLDAEPGRPVLAFVYDRHATLADAVLAERITRCRRYAVEHGWVVAGEWVDRGDHALTNWPRPSWYRLVYALQQAAAPAVCVVASWERISRVQEPRTILQLAVHRAGGYCVTASGEDDRDLGDGRITVTAPLALRGQPAEVRRPSSVRRQQRAEPFNRQPAVASLGEAPDWRGYPPTTRKGS